jgi:F-type H+-transporting ATPase subunit b
MLIDWFTVGAQAINFLVLVWLLKRFLYRPVLAAIDAREKKVAAELADAAAREAQAQAEREAFRRRNEALDRERASLMRKAADEAALERQHLLESARQESQVLRSKLTEALANERAELSRQLLARTQAEVLALARRMLTDLAGIGLEDRMTEVFIARLRNLPQEQRRLLDGGPRRGWQSASTHAALVRSAFEIPPSRRPEIQAAIRECLGADVSIRFETSPELVCGVELRVDGVKLAWSVADYLTTISEKIAALVARKPAPTSAAALPEMESQHGH